MHTFDESHDKRHDKCDQALTEENERDNYWTIYQWRLKTFDTEKMTGSKLESTFK